MRLGLIGLGRIGAFHARTLAALDAVDSLAVTDALPRTTARVTAELRAECAHAEIETARSPATLLAAGWTPVCRRSVRSPSRAASTTRERRRGNNAVRNDEVQVDPARNDTLRIDEVAR